MKKLILAVMLSVLLLGFGTAMASSSQIDNLPGGASVSYWQAGAGWETYINVQNITNAAALCIHVALYDMDSVHLGDFSMGLTPLDNVGVVIQTGSAAGSVNVLDYSDGPTFPSCTNTINDVMTGPALPLPAPADAAGISRGYATITITAIDAAAPYNDPVGTTNYNVVAKAVLPNLIYVRTAELSGSSAYASNAPMFQDYLNIKTLTEAAAANSFVSTAPAVNVSGGCDWNYDGDMLDSWNSIDDANGINIDFWELFLSEQNLAVTAPGGVICDVPGIPPLLDLVYPALGSIAGTYWARFNEDPGPGTETILNIVAPNSTRADGAAARFTRNLTVISYNDAESAFSWGPVLVPEVAGIAYGTAAGEINTGGALAGESFITFVPPAFGHTYTETASYADLYPLIRTAVGTVPINKTGTDAGAGISDVVQY